MAYLKFIRSIVYQYKYFLSTKKLLAGMMLLFLIKFGGTGNFALAQTIQPGALPPILYLLLSGDDCITPINTNTVVFDNLDPKCASEIGTNGQVAQYFGFLHSGGPLHIDLMSDFPNSFNPYLVLRQNNGRDGAIIEEDDDGHADLNSSRLVYANLSAGRYTIEATSLSVINKGAFNLSLYANKVTANASGRLNDTGILVAGTSLETSSAACDGVGDYAEQDCNFGRDNDAFVGRISGDNDQDGHDGFSFLKVSASGAPLLENATDWSCVKDNVTGLMWEIKNDSNGLSDKDNTYTWYSTDSQNNGGAVGTQNGGSCNMTSSCDTSGFVSSINSAGLCGHNDWRMATVSELHGIANLDANDPAIDTNFFPNTGMGASAIYWTAQPFIGFTYISWGFNFIAGASTALDRSNGYKVRLVRGN